MRVWNAEIRIKKKRVKQSLPEVQIRTYIAVTGLCSFSESNCTSLRHKRHDKGKAVPLQAWNGPEGSRKLRFPDFMITAEDGGKVVSLTHRPP
jgi:hypothetical protein